MSYAVIDRDGREVLCGDEVTSFRGEAGIFDAVTRMPNHAGTAKVLVNGREYYDRVWGLTVKPFCGAGHGHFDAQGMTVWCNDDSPICNY